MVCLSNFFSGFLANRVILFVILYLDAVSLLNQFTELCQVNKTVFFYRKTRKNISQIRCGFRKTTQSFPQRVSAFTVYVLVNHAAFIFGAGGLFIKGTFYVTRLILFLGSLFSPRARRSFALCSANSNAL